ncbi:lig_chan-Glu_bd domain-containing protein [Caerostris darwini]|uniref:Lig_chan-Glu_bd domain-containing protein n=1 Tax=Caerostris darwini TaxID=1538125 RepID=A0AAV4PR31_9ARAC|nr:lig_chan-Glu_bd domain-containing protein [Caerostris darwini]
MNFPKFTKVVAIESERCSITYSEDGPVASGIDIKLIDLLAQALNFQYTVHVPTDGGGYGAPNKNGTWVGVSGMLARGEVDLSAIYSPVLEEKLKILDYSTPYSTLEKTFATTLPKHVSENLVFLLPFQLELWIAILILFAIVPNTLRQLLFQRLEETRFHFSCRKTSEKQTEQTSYRIFHGSWLLVKMILCFSYTAVILSFLTVQPMQKGVKNIHELANAVENENFEFYAVKGSVTVDNMISSESEDLRKIGLANKRYGWKGVIHGSGEKIEERTAIEGARTTNHIVYGKSPFSSVLIADDAFGIWSASVMMRKDFCCKKEIDTVILRISNGGLY